MSATEPSIPATGPAATPPGESGGGVMYTWRHEHKLDAQCRVAFPAAWRPGKGADGKEAPTKFMLIVWTHTHSGSKFNFIRGLPGDRARWIQAKLDKEAIGDSRAAALRRKIYANAIELSLDQANRLVLPPSMVKDAGIGKDVIFVGTGSDWELWNPQLFAEASKSEETLANDAYSIV
jgi:division/cell wall cluster transcriptional repressor MraZ